MVTALPACIFRAMTADLAKPEIYQDWGDSEDYSLKIGRGECAV